MALPVYLAMTPGEFAASPLPEHPAYMACHFSLYGKGLQDLPESLPDGSMLILNDRIPVWNHDPRQIAEELRCFVDEHRCSACLLDLQRPDEALTLRIAEHIIDALDCPVAVTESYAEGTKSAILISSPLPNQPLSTKAGLWNGRELWLELVPETIRYTITKEESKREIICQQAVDYPHRDLRLCCSYRAELREDQAVFTLGRTQKDLHDLLAQAEKLGFTLAVGLHQQLKTFQASNDSGRATTLPYNKKPSPK